ncbi:MAG: DUF4293 domain-containing protein [Paludibacteraceae bacterium]|nr:DUF4293 domain-containing protein [Paludibacteraceae bacterium]
MIQRIQTLYLLLVVVLGVILCFFSPAGFVTPEQSEDFQEYSMGFYSINNTTNADMQFEAMNTIPMAILSVSIPLLAFIVIFLYKKRILQARMNVINVVLCLGWYAMLGLYIWFMTTKFHVDWYITPWASIPLVNLVLTLMATRRILSDEALVRAADRIR